MQYDYVFKGHICNVVTDTMFGMYYNKSTAKDVWDAMEAKYLMEDATSKKFLAMKTTDARPIVV